MSTRSFAVWQSILHRKKIDSKIVFFSLLPETSTLISTAFSSNVWCAFTFQIFILFYWVKPRFSANWLLTVSVWVHCIFLISFIFLSWMSYSYSVRWKVRAPTWIRIDVAADWDLYAVADWSAEEWRRRKRRPHCHLPPVIARLPSISLVAMKAGVIGEKMQMPSLACEGKYRFYLCAYLQHITRWICNINYIRTRTWSRRLNDTPFLIHYNWRSTLGHHTPIDRCAAHALHFFFSVNSVNE